MTHPHMVLAVVLLVQYSIEGHCEWRESIPVQETSMQFLGYEMVWSVTYAGHAGYAG